MRVNTLHNKQSKTKEEEALSYRIPNCVTETKLLKNGDAYPVCPRCRATLEREYVKYCDRCGQALKWYGYGNSKLIYTL